MNWEELLAFEVLGHSAIRLMASAVVLLAAYVVMDVFRRVVGKRLKTLSLKTNTDVDDFLADLLLHRTRRYFLIAVAIFAASLTLTLPQKAASAVKALLVVASALQAGAWGGGFINFMIKRRAARDAAEQLNLEAYSVITWIAKAVMWSLLLLLALNNLGIEVTALVAGLGVSGIAVALAVQNILGDLFASLSIVLDRPFVIGDFIIVGDLMGTVEHVGLKTTRIRSLSGEQIVFSNNDLLGSRIRNYRRMEERRVVFSVGVIYPTPAEKLEAIPTILRDAVESQARVRFDRAHFKGFGDFSLDFEIVYYVLDRDYNLYMDIQQAINMAIFRRFSAEGIEFAYPTQTLYLEKGQ